MQVQVWWTSDRQGGFTAVLVSHRGTCRLVVEPLPDGGWDWVVWTRERSERCLYGTAATASLAKGAAEAATLLMKSEDCFFTAKETMGLQSGPPYLM